MWIKKSYKGCKIQLHIHTRNGVPKRSYKIKDYVFLVSLTELDESNYVSGALRSPQKGWIVTNR